jgi:hypothetical protein
MITNKARSLSSADHIAHSLQTGKEGEADFISMCAFMGIDCIPASQEQQFKHVDFIIAGNIKIDVKGYKRSHEMGYAIIEVKNVQGKAGWCSESSEADMIAFNMGMFYHIVPKKWLLNFVRGKYKKQKDKSIVTASKMPPYQDLLYKLYQRQERQDLMMVIETADLYQCPHYWLWRNR